MHSGDGSHGSRQHQQLSAQQHCGFQGPTSHMDDAKRLPAAHWQAPAIGPGLRDPRHQPSAAAGSALPASLGAAQVLRQATQRPATSASVASAAAAAQIASARAAPPRTPFLQHATQSHVQLGSDATAASHASDAGEVALAMPPAGMLAWSSDAAPGAICNKRCFDDAASGLPCSVRCAPGALEGHACHGFSSLPRRPA